MTTPRMARPCVHPTPRAPATVSRGSTAKRSRVGDQVDPEPELRGSHPLDTRLRPCTPPSSPGRGGGVYTFAANVSRLGGPVDPSFLALISIAVAIAPGS